MGGWFAQRVWPHRSEKEEPMCRMPAVLVLGAFLGGCAGGYTLTVPDQVAPAGREATTVVRVQRHEFWVLWLPVEEAALRFRLGASPQRGAYTDKLGYAGTTVAVPDGPGRYAMTVAHLDRQGDEVTAEIPVYVWDPSRPVLAVDLDCLPPSWSDAADDAAKGLRGMAESANICYFTRRGVAAHPHAHEALRNGQYPDGPILLWQRERWHIVRGRWRMPKVVVETRLVSELPEFRKRFPSLQMGICTGGLAGKAFAEAGVKCLVIGSAGVGPADVSRYKDWAEFAAKGAP